MRQQHQGCTTASEKELQLRGGKGDSVSCRNGRNEMPVDGKLKNFGRRAQDDKIGKTVLNAKEKTD